MNRILPIGLFAAGLCTHAAMAQDRPNIILFLVDDMGWQETSVPFHENMTDLNRRYRTPNMERMAEMGVKFTQAYACAISSPSRASLMTGMNAARHGVTNWTLEYNTKTDAESPDITLPEWKYNGIQPEDETDIPHSTPVTPLPQILHDNGYFTIHCGKAHFGSLDTPGADPCNLGFDKNIAGGANGGPGSYLATNEFGSGNFHVSGLEKYYGTDTFLTEALTLEALATLDSLRTASPDRPFYLYMSHYAIHAPYDADKRFTGNYTGIDPQLGTCLNTAEVNHAALVEGMDKSLGDILDYLSEEGNEDLAANTILIFMSDNGGQGIGRQGNGNRDTNAPHRAGKGSAYLGGVHEPMMVVWPGITDGHRGGTIDSRVMIEDFFPTILEMAGITGYATRQHVDGRSFAGIIRQPDARHDDRHPLVWHFPNLWGESQDRSEGYGAYSAMLKGDYHIIYFWESQELRLYDITDDVGEQNDLAPDNKHLVRKLAGELTDSLKACGAQRPAYKSTGQLIPWPDEACAM